MVIVTLEPPNTAEDCPIRAVLSQVTGKWQLLLVLTLEEGPHRFGELKRAVGDITQRVLTENLRKLERDGYVTRTVDPGPPIAVTYALTGLGWELMEHIKALTFWAARRQSDVVENRAAYDSA